VSISPCAGVQGCRSRDRLCKIEPGFEKIASSPIDDNPWTGATSHKSCKVWASQVIEEATVRSTLSGLTSRPWGANVIGTAALSAALLAWLWPIGIGGKMLVGGDVTQFFMGLMGFLSASLSAGRLPVWNDLWGYGFPGLAESQMGVYYPPHWVLYGLLNTETAYAWSMVIHTVWGGLGAFWAAGKFGISRVGSMLAALSWSTCGFFLIHLAHPWGYTTGSWMPWALGLAWCTLVRRAGSAALAPWLLSLVLVLQILPGHFQLAFQTHVAIAVMVVWAAVERLRAHLARRRGNATAEPAVDLGRACVLMLTVLAAFPLAAAQVLPTARLARLAASQRDFEYLSGFAATPFHLVNYVAPGLFHRSPLWRPLVWDPFHTSPEESLGYVGLLPLFLACATMGREWRRDASVRLLAILAFVSLILSLGPYAPWFRHLIKVPGFSFFRAPARWGAVTALALALLAGRGFDCWHAWPRVGRSLIRFATLATLCVLLVLCGLELALACTAKPGSSVVARVFEGVFQAMPWSGDPGFEAVMAKARQPERDARLPSGLAQPMLLQKQSVDGSFKTQRCWIYAKELAETGVLLGALFWLARRTNAGQLREHAGKVALVAITFVDLWVLGRHRLLDVGPLRPLVQQSQLLARLASAPRGSRIASERLRNLPILIGLAPISAYRTLDLPAVDSLNALAQSPLAGPVFEPLVRGALGATGTSIRVYDPIENRTGHVLRRSDQAREQVVDLALANWLFGGSWTAEQGPWVREFRISRCAENALRAWAVRSSVVDDCLALDNWSGDPRDILPIIEAAEPLTDESARPEELTIDVETKEPAWVIVSQLADPEWKARWLDQNGRDIGEAEILPTFHKKDQPGGWQRVEVPGTGRFVLRFTYDASDVRAGLAISLIAWMCWIVLALKLGLQSLRKVR
jgi:hypothetical protein